MNYPKHRKVKNVVVRFFSRVKVRRNGCWEWTGGKIKGYGFFSPRGDRGATKICAHTFSWELQNCVEVPKGLVLDHLCENKSCVNPEHLEPVTQFINARRAVKSKHFHRGTCANGHILSEENLMVIRVCRTCVNQRRRKRA